MYGKKVRCLNTYGKYGMSSGMAQIIGEKTTQLSQLSFIFFSRTFFQKKDIIV